MICAYASAVDVAIYNHPLSATPSTTDPIVDPVAVSLSLYAISLALLRLLEYLGLCGGLRAGCSCWLSGCVVVVIEDILRTGNSHRLFSYVHSIEAHDLG